MLTYTHTHTKPLSNRRVAFAENGSDSTAKSEYFFPAGPPQAFHSPQQHFCGPTNTEGDI